MDRERLVSKLNEQRVFLNNSCLLYDTGVEIEAIRLAVVARVLLHDGGNGKGLLKQLDIRNAIKWRSPVILGDIEQGQKSRLAVMRHVLTPGNESFKYIPIDPELLRLEEATESMEFEEWFHQTIFVSNEGSTFSRWNFIETLAHKEGGAHVDKLKDRHKELVDLDLTNWEIDPQGNVYLSSDRPILSHMRSIAEEIRVIFESHEKLLC